MIVEHIKGMNWDSILEMADYQTGTLTLGFRVKLIRIEPDSHSQGGVWIRDGILRKDGAKFPLDAWTEQEWSNFRQELPTAVERVWNDRIWLFPNREWYSSNPDIPLQPLAIKCRLRLVVTDAGKPHVTFRCIKIKAGGKLPPSYVQPYYRRGMLEQDDTTQTLKESSPITSATDYWEVLQTPHFYQTIAAHEFGHVLKLGHVNEGKRGCGTDTNADSCYGKTTEEKLDVMGVGNTVTARVGRPFKASLSKVLDQLNLHRPRNFKLPRRLTWKTEDAPLLQPHYPRTPLRTRKVESEEIIIQQPAGPELGWDPFTNRVYRH